MGEESLEILQISQGNFETIPRVEFHDFLSYIAGILPPKNVIKILWLACLLGSL